MKAKALLCALAACVVLGGCQQQAEQESADDFANRIGANGAASGPSQAEVQAQANMPNAAVAALPAGVQATQLQRLGDIGMVDLGQRTGGCTFMEVGREVFFTSGNPQGGKGVIRVGGELVTVDAAGNVDAIKTGTTFSAPGVSISVAPAAGNDTRRPANMVVTDAGGVTQSYSGDWICG